MKTETDTPPNPLLSLKAGDVVIEDCGDFGRDYLRAVKIFRVTATQIVIRTEREGAPPYDARYNREDGYAKGDHGAYPRRSRLLIPTQELKDKIEKRKLVERLSALKWGGLHLDTLRAVNAATKIQPPATP